MDACDNEERLWTNGCAPGIGQRRVDTIDFHMIGQCDRVYFPLRTFLATDCTNRSCTFSRVSGWGSIEHFIPSHVPLTRLGRWMDPGIPPKHATGVFGTYFETAVEDYPWSLLFSWSQRKNRGPITYLPN